MSAKKDTLVNIGGWLAVNDDALFEEARNLVVVYEGLHTYGGLAGRDMEAMAVGIVESVQDDHMRVARRPGALPGRAADRLGHPDRAARSAATRSSSTPSAFYPHLAAGPVSRPDAGGRAVPRLGHPHAWSGASCSAGRDPETGDHNRPKLELVRLTIPRRVYTQAHMDVVAESVTAVYDARDAARGLRMVYEPKYLRFFQARFEPIA